VALGYVSSEYFEFPCQFTFHILLHKHHHLSSGAGKIGQTVAAVPSGLSLTPWKNKEKRFPFAISHCIHCHYRFDVMWKGFIRPDSRCMESTRGWMGSAYLSGTDLFPIVQSLQTAGTLKPVIPVVVFNCSSPLAGSQLLVGISRIQKHTHQVSMTSFHYSCIVCLFNDAVSSSEYSIESLVIH
jgi:hypothetical protein